MIPKLALHSANIVWIVPIGLAALAVLIYNRLVLARMRTREAWAGVDVQLRRRTDLIPNLIEAVRGYCSHEHQLLAEVTRARAELAEAFGPVNASTANRKLQNAVTRLIAVAENYPQLRASELFLQLQNDLFDIEEKIAYARHFYNRNVLAYNTKLRSFPGVLVAALFGFRPAEFFEGEDGQRASAEVAFNAR